MKRSLIQAYVIGSDKALDFYRTAFDASIVVSYPNDDGTYMHAELDIHGQILAVSERDSVYKNKGETVTGNTMQFCLQYGEGNERLVENAYNVLKEDAEIISSLAPCSYSPLMAALIDKYGVHWCLFV